MLFIKFTFWGIQSKIMGIFLHRLFFAIVTAWSVFFFYFLWLLKPHNVFYESKKTFFSSNMKSPHSFHMIFFLFLWTRRCVKLSATFCCIISSSMRCAKNIFCIWKKKNSNSFIWTESAEFSAGAVFKVGKLFNSEVGVLVKIRCFLADSLHILKQRHVPIQSEL